MPEHRRDAATNRPRDRRAVHRRRPPSAPASASTPRSPSSAGARDETAGTPPTTNTATSALRRPRRPHRQPRRRTQRIPDPRPRRHPLDDLRQRRQPRPRPRLHPRRRRHRRARRTVDSTHAHPNDNNRREEILASDLRPRTRTLPRHDSRRARAHLPHRRARIPHRDDQRRAAGRLPHRSAALRSLRARGHSRHEIEHSRVLSDRAGPGGSSGSGATTTAARRRSGHAPSIRRPDPDATSTSRARRPTTPYGLHAVLALPRRPQCTTRSRRRRPRPPPPTGARIRQRAAALGGTGATRRFRTPRTARHRDSHSRSSTADRAGKTGTIAAIDASHRSRTSPEIEVVRLTTVHDPDELLRRSRNRRMDSRPTRRAAVDRVAHLGNPREPYPARRPRRNTREHSPSRRMANSAHGMRSSKTREYNSSQTPPASTSRRPDAHSDTDIGTSGSRPPGTSIDRPSCPADYRSSHLQRRRRGPSNPRHSRTPPPRPRRAPARSGAAAPESSPCNHLSVASRSQQQMVGAAIRQVFAAPTREEARAILTTSSRASSVSRRKSHGCSKTPRGTCSRFSTIPPSTARSCARRTRSSASTARSAGAPT